MIATRIIISNTASNLQSFEEFNSIGIDLVLSERNSFIDDLMFSIKQGWIKNMHNQYWDADSKSVIYEYYSDDLHQTRYFQNYMSSKNYFSQGVNKLDDNGWSLTIETVPERIIVPFVDADRIFDQDIEVLA